MKIIEPPRLTAEHTSQHQSQFGIVPVEGELVRHQGEIFKMAIDSEGIGELSGATHIRLVRVFPAQCRTIK